MTAHHLRIVDKSSYLNMKDADFSLRRNVPIRRIGMIFVIISFVAVLFAIAFYYKHLEGMAICLAFGIMLYFVAAQLQNLQKMQNATEFMNALFSSALSEGYKFCFVTRKDGVIVYMNRGFQSLFEEFALENSHDVLGWLEASGSSEDVKQNVLNNLNMDRPTNAIVSLHTSDKEHLTAYTLHINPIKRPSGFVLVRGS